MSNANKKGEYEKPFKIKALNENFILANNGLVSYNSLQWDRKFHEPGQFVLELSANAYSDDWRYIYSEKRNELGIISQVNFKKDDDGRKTVTVSGLFEESRLNQMIVYPKPTQFDDDSGTHYGTSLLHLDSPLWLTQEGTADVVARAFFDGFKSINFRNYEVGDTTGQTIVTSNYELPITFGTVASGTYHRAIHTRNGEKLGSKIYDILNESNASYQVVLDYDSSQLIMNIVHGVDRSESRADSTVNPITLSTMNGTIKSASFVKSNSSTKDVVIQCSQSEEQTLVLINQKPNAIGRFTFQSMSSNQGDYIKEDTPDKAAADKEHKLAVLGDATSILYSLRDKINIEVDASIGSYKYKEDFDLGDIISIEIPEIGISADVEICECHEVVKEGAWSLSLTLGTPIIRKRGM